MSWLAIINSTTFLIRSKGLDRFERGIFPLLLLFQSFFFVGRLFNFELIAREISCDAESSAIQMR